MIKKNFDCLKMKEEVQVKVYQDTIGMSFAELRGYFNSHLNNNFFWKKINSDKFRI